MAKITFSLPEDVIAALRKRCEQEQRPLSMVVRRALESYFKSKSK